MQWCARSPQLDTYIYEKTSLMKVGLNLKNMTTNITSVDIYHRKYTDYTTSYDTIPARMTIYFLNNMNY
jgi:hypothetical protein